MEGPKIIVVRGDWEDVENLQSLTAAIQGVLALLPYGADVRIEDDPEGECVVREYRSERRYGYGAVDECMDGKCLRTLLSGIKPQYLADEIAGDLNAAYAQGRQDARAEIAATGADYTPDALAETEGSEA